MSLFVTGGEWSSGRAGKGGSSRGCAARGQHGRIAGWQRGSRDAVRLQREAQAGVPPPFTGGLGSVGRQWAVSSKSARRRMTRPRRGRRDSRETGGGQGQYELGVCCCDQLEKQEVGGIAEKQGEEEGQEQRPRSPLPETFAGVAHQSTRGVPPTRRWKASIWFVTHAFLSNCSSMSSSHLRCSC